jgi:hypothetical protein
MKDNYSSVVFERDGDNMERIFMHFMSYYGLKQINNFR